MPIGKNAIKRVENNGYSKVQTSAPDMENSHVIANPDPQVLEKLVTPVEEAAKPAPKKRGRKPAVKAAEPVQEPKSAPKAKAPAKKKAAKPAPEKNGFERVEVGTDMPYFLL